MKIKYLFYIGVATLALSGCNDGFLERAPEAINDKTFWNTTGDLETYANQFYSYLPGGVTSIADGESDNQVPNSIPQFFWNQLSTLRKQLVGVIGVKADGNRSGWSTIS